MAFAFQPIENVRTSATAFSATSVSLPFVGRNVRIANVGPSDCNVLLTQSFTFSTANSFVLLARTVEVFDRTTNTTLVAQGINGGTLLDITTGEGQ